MTYFAIQKEQLDFIIEELRAIRPSLPREVPLQACYTEDLKLDSLDLLELAARIEQRFGLRVPDVDLDHFMSVEDTLRYLSLRLKPRQ